MKKILALGYIPKGKGGKQETGLATGIFDLHDAVNKLSSDYKITIAATDIHLKQTTIDNTAIIGWNKKTLILHSLQNLNILLKSFIYAISLLRYSPIIKLNTIVGKLLFLDYALKISQPDILHLHGATGALLSKFFIKKIPIILRIHGINGYDESIPFFNIYKKVEKRITNIKFSYVTFVTERIKNEWIEKYGEFPAPMISILNGYNHSIFRINKERTENKKYDLITFSGISERKGQIRVIETISKLKNEGLHLSYLVIGSTTTKYKALLEKKVKDENLSVYFIDYIPQEDLVRYLHLSKYFILPSITEGFGKVYIESIGCGIPVIIPKDLPLCHEKNFINQINSIKLEDSSTNSIYNALKSIDFNKNINKNEISNSVKDLQWSKIANDYIKVYDKISL